MQDIDRARAILKAVEAWPLARFDRTVFEGVEHRCWRIDGPGWHATISNLWEVMNAAGFAGRGCEYESAETVRCNMLELYVQDETERVVGFSHDDDDPSRDLLYSYRRGVWESLFAPAMWRHADDLIAAGGRGSARRNVSGRPLPPISRARSASRTPIRKISTAALFG